MDKKKQKYHGSKISIALALTSLLASGYELSIYMKRPPYEGELTIYDSISERKIPVILESKNRFETGSISYMQGNLKLDCELNQKQSTCILDLKENRDKIKQTFSNLDSYHYKYMVINKTKALGGFHLMCGNGFFLLFLGFVSYHMFTNQKEVPIEWEDLFSKPEKTL